MAEDHHNSPTPPDSGVPGLIDQYRQQRRAWLAQADELVRLRDEVRSAAEREAMDIVTAARRDVRQIVVEARRELMVLTAQLHAAMDAVEQSSVASAMPLRSGNDDSVGNEAFDAQTSLSVTKEMVLGARREVRSVLDEARAEIEALAAEAPVPFSNDERSSIDQDRPRIGAIIPEEPRAEEPRLVATSDSQRADKLMSPAINDAGIFAESHAGFPAFRETEVASPYTSRVLASAETEETPRARSAMTFVALFAGVGVLVTTGTVWWLFSGKEPAARQSEAAPAAVTTPPTESSVTPSQSSTLPAGTATRNSMSLTIEARRPSWIRVSIDGQPDAGRLYQAGETREIAGARSVVIRAGDAGAVFVAVNGDRARPLGDNGEVMTRRYAVETTDPAPPIASAASERDSDEGRGGAGAAQPSPVTLAVEKSGRPAAPRPETRTPAAPAASSQPPASANPSSREASTQTPSGRPDLVVAGQQWLDAYQRRDRQAMSGAGAENITVTDERSTAERFPSWQNGVQRELDQVELALTGDTALLTARMTERTDGASATPHVSRVSQIWVRRSGQWRLADVRIMAESRLNQIVR